jgi:hypothetical protein
MIRMKVHYPSAARFFVAVSFLAFSFSSAAQTCYSSEDMEPATLNALQNTAMRYFDMVSQGDAASLRQNSIPAVASNFAAIENTIKDNQSALTGAHATFRPPFELKAEGTAPLSSAEFLCGVFNGPQVAKAAEFVIPNLPPGIYAIAILDVSAQKSSYTLSFVLQQEGTDWKLAGFYLRSSRITGHDSAWFLEHARDFKTKGQTHNAWLYYLVGRDLAMPVPFMYTQATGKLYDEEQSVRPADFPIDGSTVELAAQSGKSYKLTAIFALPVGQNLDLVVKYLNPDVSNSGQTFEENMNVMRTLLAKFPELRSAFDGVVIRAVEPSGRDYGSMMPMSEIK